jgi:hypothetical protein
VPGASCFGERITTTRQMQRPLIGRAVPWCAHRSGTLLGSQSSGRVVYMEAGKEVDRMEPGSYGCRGDRGRGLRDNGFSTPRHWDSIPRHPTCVSLKSNSERNRDEP